MLDTKKALFVAIAALCVGAALMFWYLKRSDGPEPPPGAEVLVMRTKGGLLEVSTVRATEVFAAKYVYSFFGIPLGRTVTKIRVPAYYKYQIALAPEWRVLRTGAVFTVITPPVRVSLPVAVDLAKLEQYDSGTWIFAALNNKADMATLQREITASLAKRALNPRYISLQREAARKTVEEFVRKWLLTQTQWSAESPSTIRVLFSDEPIGAFGVQAFPQLGPVAGKAGE